jgi:hypothetical protein
MSNEICPVCGKERSACCPCDIAYLDSRAQLQLNYERWREKGPFGAEYKEKIRRYEYEVE